MQDVKTVYLHIINEEKACMYMIENAGSEERLISGSISSLAILFRLRQTPAVAI